MAHNNTLHDTRFWRITNMFYETAAQTESTWRAATKLMHAIDMKHRPREVWPLYCDLPDVGQDEAANQKSKTPPPRKWLAR